MNVSVILGHPYDGSFNAAIAQTVVQTLEEDGHAVAFHDLHAEGFNPVIPPSELVSDVPADDGGSRPPSSRDGSTACCGRAWPTGSPRAIPAAACPSAC